jgi:hypothetical protein
MKYDGVEVGRDPILFMSWPQNEGETDKNISRQDAKHHYQTAAVTSGITLGLSYLPVTNSHI